MMAGTAVSLPRQGPEIIPAGCYPMPMQTGAEAGLQHSTADALQYPHVASHTLPAADDTICTRGSSGWPLQQPTFRHDPHHHALSQHVPRQPPHAHAPRSVPQLLLLSLPALLAVLLHSTQAANGAPALLAARTVRPAGTAQARQVPVPAPARPLLLIITDAASTPTGSQPGEAGVEGVQLAERRRGARAPPACGA